MCVTDVCAQRRSGPCLLFAAVSATEDCPARQELKLVVDLGAYLLSSLMHVPYLVWPFFSLLNLFS